MIRSLGELVCIACVVAGFYLAWAPLGFISAGAIAWLWLGLTGGPNNGNPSG